MLADVMRWLRPLREAIARSPLHRVQYYSESSSVKNLTTTNMKQYQAMFIKDVRHCDEFIARAKTILRELLHPDKADLRIHYSLAHAVVRPGQTSQLHALKPSEVYYILEGEGIVHIDDETAGVHPGQAIYIPPNARQYILNTGKIDLKFLCIVDPAWHPGDEEVLDVGEKTQPQ